MARSRKDARKNAGPEVDSQAPSTEEGTDTLLEATAGRPINLAELVRKAVAAGHDKPAGGIAYIKSEFGVDVDSKYYSVAKSQQRKRESKVTRGRGASTAIDGYVAPPDKPREAGEPDMLLALEGVKDLIGRYGAERVKKMVELLS